MSKLNVKTEAGYVSVARGPRGFPGQNGADGLAIFTKEVGMGGMLAVFAAPSRLYNDTGKTISLTSIRASVGIAPTGASVIVDVFKDGVTLFTGGAGRPTIAASGFTSKVVPAVTTWEDGTYLTFSVIQVGSTIPGSDLTVQMTGNVL